MRFQNEFCKLQRNSFIKSCNKKKPTTLKIKMKISLQKTKHTMLINSFLTFSKAIFQSQQITTKNDINHFFGEALKMHVPTVCRGNINNSSYAISDHKMKAKKIINKYFNKCNAGKEGRKHTTPPAPAPVMTAHCATVGLLYCWLVSTY